MAAAKTMEVAFSVAGNTVAADAELAMLAPDIKLTLRLVTFRIGIRADGNAGPARAMP